MRLPPEMSEALRREIETVDRAELSKAVAQLTQQYKSGRFSSAAIKSQAHRSAYLAVRLPATFAANLRVFSEIRRLAPEAAIASILDLGAGPGTSVLAAAQIFPSLNHATLVERDSSLIEFGRHLARESSSTVVCNSRWLQRDLKAGFSSEPHDLVVISYALNELATSEAQKTVSLAWQHARQLVAIIEPGTMRGFGFIHAARAQLIAEGAHILAPCPHAAACPLATAGDWCHFAQRIDRTSLHRQLKSGALGYEDEKFSYIVAALNPLSAAQARVVRHPQKHGGHVQLLLCTAHGLKAETISKSQGETYKLARKVEWGDAWP